MAQGPLLMVLSTVAFTAMVVLVKIGRTDLAYGALQLIVWRSLAGVPLVALLTGRKLAVQRPGLLALRCLFGFGAMFSFFSAARSLGVGELTVIVKLQPIAVALLAPLALGTAERADPRGIAALVMGMSGTVALLWPDLQLGAWTDHLTGAAWACSAAACSAVAHTTLRALGPTEDARVVVFWFQAAVGVVAVAGVMASGGLPLPPAPWAWATVLGIGACAAIGQLLMTRAYQVERAARVAAASYTAPLFGFLADAVLFGRTPGWHATAGMLLVVGGGLLVVVRRTPRPEPGG